MDLKEYHDLLLEIADIDTEVSSIAECRKLLNDLDERKKVLRVFRENIKQDIRSIESHYLQEKTAIRKKYEGKKSPSSGLRGILTGKSTRMDEMKKLEKERKDILQPYYNFRDMADELMEEMEDIKTPVDNMIKEKFDNF